MTPRILTLDIETSPNIADVWSLWQQNVSLSQLREVTRVLCFAAKWKDDSKVHYFSDFHDGHDKMVAKAWEMVDQADIVVHFNGKQFDMPHLHREFLLAGASPPSPVQEVDLLQVVRAKFKFASNKLDHVAAQLGLGQKVHHEGHTLWVKCMAGDRQAWNQMRTYNKHDVVLTEQLYDRLIAWVPGHPHMALFTEDAGQNICSRCTSANLRPRGYSFTAMSKFQRYRCDDCGAWSRGKKALDKVDVRAVA